MGNSVINRLHDLAMDIMNEAEALKDKDIALAKKYFLQAFELERYAAERVAALPESSEPSSFQRGDSRFQAGGETLPLIFPLGFQCIGAKLRCPSVEGVKTLL